MQVKLKQGNLHHFLRYRNINRTSQCNVLKISKIINIILQKKEGTGIIRRERISEINYK